MHNVDPKFHLRVSSQTPEKFLTLQMDKIRRGERLWPEINPAPLFSGPMDSCFEHGTDVSAAGAKYNTSGICCVGLADAVDSLAVIRQLVYEEKRCTMQELRVALDADWQGYEELRQEAICHVPKWENNDDAIADFLGQRINCEPNAGNRVFQTALYGIIVAARELGANTGTLSNGYMTGEPLTMNTGATPGRDKNGLTSLINSVTKINLLKAVWLSSSISLTAKFFVMLRHILKNMPIFKFGSAAGTCVLAPNEQDIFIAKSEVA